MKICMLGAGALGCSIGGVLARGGSDVIFVDRYQAHVDAINAHGLKIRFGDTEETVRVRAFTSCEGLQPVDLTHARQIRRYTRGDTGPLAGWS